MERVGNLEFYIHHRRQREHVEPESGRSVPWYEDKRAELADNGGHHRDNLRIPKLFAMNKDSIEYRRYRSGHTRNHSSVACTWPACGESVLVQELLPSKYQQYVRYKLIGAKDGGSLRYPICEKHRARVLEVLGPQFRMNGIKAIAKGDGDVFASRNVGSPMIRLVLWDRANGECQSCRKALSFDGKGIWEIDHIKPISLGGITALSNLQVLCIECHEEKSRPERGLANKHRFNAMRAKRWHSHHQKDVLIVKLQTEIARLKTIIAGYASEEEMAG